MKGTQRACKSRQRTVVLWRLGCMTCMLLLFYTVIQDNILLKLLAVVNNILCNDISDYFVVQQLHTETDTQIETRRDNNRHTATDFSSQQFHPDDQLDSHINLIDFFWPVIGSSCVIHPSHQAIRRVR